MVLCQGLPWRSPPGLHRLARGRGPTRVEAWGVEGEDEASRPTGRHRAPEGVWADRDRHHRCVSLEEGCAIDGVQPPFVWDGPEPPVGGNHACTRRASRLRDSAAHPRGDRRQHGRLPRPGPLSDAPRERLCHPGELLVLILSITFLFLWIFINKSPRLCFCRIGSLPSAIPQRRCRRMQ